MRLSTSLRLNAQKGLVTPYDPTLTLSLQFATRQAYVSDFGPLPTFTNATTTARTFVGSDGLLKTAGLNVPRIEFDPITRQCLGLLIEEQRQNLCVQSENVTAANWGKSNISVTADQTTAPTGVVSADLVAESAVSGFHTVTIPSGSVTSGTVYTFSLFLKKGSGSTSPNWIILGLGSSFPNSSVAFNVSTGAFGAVSGVSFTYAVKQYTDGWWRVSLTATATGTGASQPLSVIFSNNANTASAPSYLGVVTSDLFVWGVQFEAGSFASSYIPTTTTAPLVRSADVCSITGAAFTGFYNQTEGAMVVKVRKINTNAAVTPKYLSFDNNNTTERIYLYHGGVEAFLVTDGGATQATISSGVSAPVDTLFGMAARYKLNDFAMSYNGNTSGTVSTGTVPTPDRLTIGQALGGGYMAGHIHTIQYFNAIKTNAQLQALSTP